MTVICGRTCSVLRTICSGDELFKRHLQFFFVLLFFAWITVKSHTNPINHTNPMGKAVDFLIYEWLVFHPEITGRSDVMGHDGSENGKPPWKPAN